MPEPTKDQKIAVLAWLIAEDARRGTYLDLADQLASLKRKGSWRKELPGLELYCSIDACKPKRLLGYVARCDTGLWRAYGCEGGSSEFTYDTIEAARQYVEDNA